MTIRPARLDELADVQRVGRLAYRRFLATAHPELAEDAEIPDQVAIQAIDQGRLAVAILEGEVVGWSYVGRLGDEFCLGEICVLPKYGQHGVGSALLESVSAAACSAGETSIVLATQRDIFWNMSWYQAHGYETIDPKEWTSAMKRLEQIQGGQGGLDWKSRVFMRRELD